jgi:branched-subunit amino acid aminotransferase/4-amino-4-deoxychorismate lyase
MRGCWAFGYVGYEAASGLGPGLAVFDQPQDGPPLVWFGLREEPVAVPRIAPPPAGGRDYAAERWQPGWTPCGYRRDVARVRDYIAAGDTYQCNLTVRLRSRVQGDLRQLCPTPNTLDRHLDRLASSAGYFGFPFDPERARTEIAAALGQAGAARVRLLLDRSGAVSIELGPAPVRSARPVTLAVDLQPIDPNQRWLYHKTTRRQTYTARARRHPTVDDVVLVNDRGQVTETTVANLAVQLDGSWYTPPLDAGCLPGVERGRLLELGRLRERDLTPEDLHRADALALVSSVRGWRPAVLAVHPPAQVTARPTSGRSIATTAVDRSTPRHPQGRS